MVINLLFNESKNIFEKRTMHRSFVEFCAGRGMFFAFAD